jgi:hypothetical protein
MKHQLSFSKPLDSATMLLRSLAMKECSKGAAVFSRSFPKEREVRGEDAHCSSLAISRP